jgi:metal-sulfur cluster biosynthetic enzyme
MAQDVRRMACASADRRVMKRMFIVLVCSAGVSASLFSQVTQLPKEEFSEAIEDNSFFIEEAYNQEQGVVQHISNLQYSFTNEKNILYTFTQEWPLGGRDHQLSYTVPIGLYSSSHPGGLGDLLINYRYQLVDNGGWANVAPRLSIILPTGSVRSALGSGTTGLQINVAASRRFSRAFVSHVSAGPTYLPHMKDESTSAGTIRHTLTSYNEIYHKGTKTQKRNGDADSTLVPLFPIKTMEEEQKTALTEEAVYDALKECYDPEIPVDIVNLGLVYGVTIVDDWVGVKMTLTSPGCPASSMISEEVKQRVRQIPGVGDADVRIVWQPEWKPTMMSEEARRKLGMNK